VAAHRGAAQARRRWRVATVSVGLHLALLLAVLQTQGSAPMLIEPRPMAVQLVNLRPPVQPPQPPAPTPDPPAKAKPPPPRAIVRPTPLRAEVDPLPAGKGPSAEGTAEVSEAALASAATAGSGGGGGCDMARWLQSALRKDARVQAAVAEAHRGKAVMIWNGEWIRDGLQDGNGLAAVREAIQWEVGFAPVACRAEPVHGLVLISLNDGPGASRLVVGSGDWRWSDLLHVRR
jgi:hypothetical protein